MKIIFNLHGAEIKISQPKLAKMLRDEKLYYLYNQLFTTVEKIVNYNDDEKNESEE